MTHTQNGNSRSCVLISLMPALNRLARILSDTPDQAEDLAQETLLRVWSRLQRGDDIEDLRPYLMTALRNTARKVPPPEQPLTETDIPSCAPAAPARLACQNVRDAIRNLSTNHGTLLHLHAQSGASYAELARTQNLPLGTIMSRISRARARLRTDMNLPPDHAVETLLDTR